MTEIPVRFMNFLLDTFIYFVILILFLMVSRDFTDVQNAKWISVLIYFSYYFLFEYFKGQTPGKMLTKSQVLSIAKKNNYFFWQIVVRTLMRFIPLDIFSYLFSARGLHDWVSNTKVSDVIRRTSI